jgi:hypothetical protein
MASTHCDRLSLDRSKQLGRLGELGDIMGAFVFLASNAAAMITVTSLLIDRSWTAGEMRFISDR